jgi:hypothetical protein
MSGTRMPVELRAVDARLRDAAADAAWPASPDLRDAVLARIAAGPATTAVPERPAPAHHAAQAPRGTRPRLSFARALVLAILALIALAGVAAALGFRLPGLDIVFVDRIPTASGATGPGVDRAELLVGSPVPIAEALEGGERPAIRLPDALPAPTTAWVLGSGSDRIVTVAWAAKEGEPSIQQSGLAFVLTMAPGGLDRQFLQKSLGPGSTIELARVGDDIGWWIGGARHELFIIDPDGQVAPLESRLAGDVLVFARDGTVYRLESALGKDATMAIAVTLR